MSAPAGAATRGPAHFVFGTSFVALRSNAAKTLNVSGNPEPFSISEQVPAMSACLGLSPVPGFSGVLVLFHNRPRSQAMSAPCLGGSSLPERSETFWHSLRAVVLPTLSLSAICVQDNPCARSARAFSGRAGSSRRSITVGRPHRRPACG